jgi:formylglycine-generating enzyme
MFSARSFRWLALLALGLGVVTCGEEIPSDSDAGTVSDATALAADAAEATDATAPALDASGGRDATAALDATSQNHDAATGRDAAEPPDASAPGVDAAHGHDAAAPGLDASGTDLDAGSADASRGDAAWCTAGGLPGTCIDVAECYGTREPTAGLCPGPAAIQCCTPRYAVDCDPNAVPQPNAGLTEEAGVGGCPAGMLRVSTFCIDRFEAALDEILADGSLVPWSPYFNPTGHRVRALSLRGAVPQGYINQIEASAACVEAGKRMCTDTEWLRACRGPSDTTYPYGNARQTGVCNDHRAVHPAVELYGTSDTWI